MKTKRYLITPGVFTVCIVLSLTLKSQSSISPALATALQNSINTLRATYNVKGISAAAYIPHQGIWKGVTGISHGTVPIDTTMLFSMGSITKTFVASEIFKLIENNLLSLDDSLYRLIPPVNHVNGNITIRQLLGHKSGLADYLNANWQNAMFDDPYKIWYQPAAIDSFITAPLAAPGGPWGYINANYALLGMVIEARQSDSLHTVLRNEFLTPFNLEDTHMEIFETYPNTIPHNWSAPNMNPSLASDVSATPHEALWSSVSAAGGYFSSPSDLAKWGYNLYSGNVISQSSLTDMLTFTNVSSSYFNGYGLGAQRFTGNGKTYWGHAGNYFGYAACMLYYPQDSICVAVLINQDCYGANIAKPLMYTAISNIAAGINAVENNAMLQLYPNPTEGIITISGTKDEEQLIEVFDLTGKMLFHQSVQGTETLDLGFLSEGIYELIAKSEKTISNQKLVIVK